ncbi:MAG: T9SS type A sorting domain-containing protein [Bacteroidetes bacterium]|nr:T9SS type A sorting domain-containing protein [Bacteroidota bacterium]
MRRILLLFWVLFVFSGGITNAQQSINVTKISKGNGVATIQQKRKCGTMEYNAQLEAADPGITIKKQETEKFIQKWIENNQDYINNSKTVVTVPVVVHVVYKTTAQNISDTRVNEQITCLNRDYGGLNTHSMGSFATSLKANTELQFCLAQRKPDGTATNGIDRVSTTVTSFSTNNAVKYTSQGGADAWDPTKYMNIWVCNLGSSLCGYAQFPTSGINATFGVVILYQCFGVTGASPPYNQGGTTSHEIGHCFNLYHIWGDDGGTCSGTDYSADTPNQASETYGAPTGVLTDACSPSSPGIMYMNFMDYSDDAAYANFTPNQKARIQALFTPGGLLYSLTSSLGCVPPGGATIPTVTTTTATSITATTAASGGNVTVDGGATVTARGVCWGTSANPVATGSHTTDGSGTGTFTSSITGLTASTLYHYRAYATNSAGTAYGSDLTFTTSASASLPTLTTTSASSVTNTTAVSGGNISSQGSSAVTARGVCWATTSGPTISGSHTTDGSGTGTFTSNITGLTLGTLYYVRAYATNTSGTAYGNEITFTTTGGTTSCDTLMPASFTSGTCNLAIYYIDVSPYDSGYVCGQNAWLDKEKAMLYSGTGGGTISDVFVLYGLKKGTTGNTSVKIYSSNGGAPGTLLGTSATIVKSAIDTTNQGINFNNKYHFSTPVTVGADFFVSVVLPTGFNNTTNQLAIWSVQYACSSTSPLAYEMWYDDNSWHPFSTVYGTNIDMAIFPDLCPLVDVNSNHMVNTINIYPNPSESFINIDLGKYSLKDVKIYIYDAIGKQIGLINRNDAENKLRYDFTPYGNGLYIIYFDTPEGNVVKKVSINR